MRIRSRKGAPDLRKEKKAPSSITPITVSKAMLWKLILIHEMERMWSFFFTECADAILLQMPTCATVCTMRKYTELVHSAFQFLLLFLFSAVFVVLVVILRCC